MGYVIPDPYGVAGWRRWVAELGGAAESGRMGGGKKKKRKISFKKRKNKRNKTGKNKSKV